HYQGVRDKSMMTAAPRLSSLLERTRRHFFRECGVGLGAIALGSLLADDAARGAHPSGDRATNPLAPRPGHARPRAKNVISLFMPGGPRPLDPFDFKP